MLALAMNRLENMIIGNKILKIVLIEDYIQILFSNGSILNMYNDVAFSHQYQQYSNEIVEDFVISDLLMCIKVDGKEISMGMKEDDYSTPEAFEFHSGDSELIVG